MGCNNRCIVSKLSVLDRLEPGLGLPFLWTHSLHFHLVVRWSCNEGRSQGDGICDSCPRSLHRCERHAKFRLRSLGVSLPVSSSESLIFLRKLDHYSDQAVLIGPFWSNQPWFQSCLTGAEFHYSFPIRNNSTLSREGSTHISCWGPGHLMWNFWGIFMVVNLVLR